MYIKLTILTTLVFLELSSAPSFAQDMLFKSTLANNITQDHEIGLVQALDKISNNRIDDALRDLEILVHLNPKFRLAQLVYADLLMAQTHPIKDFGNFSSAPYEEIVALREEAKSRLRYYQIPKTTGLLPKSFVQMDNKHKYAIIVDLTLPRLYIFENDNGVPKQIADFYATIGKNGIGKLVEGDQRTPIGVYFASGFIEPEELPDLYGDGAFPINYPNAWDRRNGHTGYGIWIHGTPSDTYSRPPRDSDGCVIVSNQDLNTIAPYITAGRTPVVLTENIEWISQQEWITQQGEFQQHVEQWRRDWESRNPDLYLSHYSRDYEGLGKSYDDWVAYKQRVNSSKTYIKVGMSETSMFRYTNGNNILVVTFEQNYRSNDVKRKTRKRQYWKKEEDGRWRIFYEDSVS